MKNVKKLFQTFSLSVLLNSTAFAGPLPGASTTKLCDGSPLFCEMERQYVYADRAAMIEEVNEVAANPGKYSCTLVSWARNTPSRQGNLNVAGADSIRTYLDELEITQYRRMSYDHPALKYTMQFRKNDGSPELYFVLSLPIGYVSRGICSLR